MSKPDLIKRSGWVFVAGAFGFLTILSSSVAIQITVAMSSLRKGHGERISRLGGNMLLLGMSGPDLWVIGIVFMSLMGVEAVQKGLWVLLFVGPAISLLGLTLFGLTAIVNRPLPHLNWLPLLTGICYPMGYVLFSIYDISHKGVFSRSLFACNCIGDSDTVHNIVQSGIYAN